MKGTINQTTVNGKKFTYWADYIDRATWAKDEETGEEKKISSSGYISNDLTVRKAIASVFHLPTFRK